MNEFHTEWTDRFSEYLAEELDTPTRERLEGHVAECGACRRVLEDLRDVVARAHGLGELQPARDLWPGIAAAIGGPVRARPPHTHHGKVIALPTATRGRGPARPGAIAVTIPQLAAAAVVLIAVSAAMTLWAGPGLGTRAVEATSTPVAATTAGPAVTMAADVAPSAELSSELTELQDVLDAARARLDPNTVRVIERNLGVIEQAISDSRRALLLDPGNEFLEHHLNRAYERKVEYLRDAARAIEWAG